MWKWKEEMVPLEISQKKKKVTCFVIKKKSINVMKECLHLVMGHANWMLDS